MVRLGFIIGFIALIGVLLSGLAAYRVHDQELALDGIALARAILLEPDFLLLDEATASLDEASEAALYRLLRERLPRMAIISIGGWDAIEGAKPLQVAYIVLYLVLAVFVLRWNRGVLPLIAAVAIVLLIFAAVSAPAWFDRDKAGFDQPTLDPSLLGLLTLILVPMLLLTVMWVFLARRDPQGRGVAAFSRSSAKLVPEEGTGVTFDAAVLAAPAGWQGQGRLCEQTSRVPCWVHHSSLPGW